VSNQEHVVGTSILDLPLPENEYLLRIFPGLSAWSDLISLVFQTKTELPALTESK
jgi:hypothetical protein